MNALVQLTQRTDALLATTVGLGAVITMMLQGSLQLTDRFMGFEAVMRRPIAMGMMALVVGIFFSIGAVNIPSRIKSTLSRPEMRFLLLTLAGLASAGDLETAIIGTLFVISLLQLIRTPEERRQTPFMA